MKQEKADQLAVQFGVFAENFCYFRGETRKIQTKHTQQLVLESVSYRHRRPSCQLPNRKYYSL
jgi:hypothetical protein